METNAAYNCIQRNAAATEDSIYELVDVNPEPVKSSSKWSPAEVEIKKREAEIKKENKSNFFNILIATIAVTALLLVLIFLSFFPVHYASYQQLLETQQSAGIETMQLLLNSSNEQLQLQASELKEAQRFIQSLQLQLNKTVELRESLQNDFHIFIKEQQTNELLTEICIQGIKQELNNTINLIKHVILLRSCNDLPQGSPSGYYHISTNDTGVIRVYCDTSARYCSCSTSGGWMRVANLDMTDPTQQCPDGFKLINRTEPPLRTCGRPDGTYGCVSTTFKAHGIKYSRVCGQIVGYQIGSPSGFRYQSEGIDSHYVSGISLTHGQPRQHIYTFANAQGEGYTSEICPCIQGGTDTVPLFVGSDYFCDSAVRGSNATLGVFYSYDPLWDGQGCGSTSTCCEFNDPKWFCKQLPQPTTDDIEMRLCENGPPIRDDAPFETVELYIS